MLFWTFLCKNCPKYLEKTFSQIFRKWKNNTAKNLELWPNSGILRPDLFTCYTCFDMNSQTEPHYLVDITYYLIYYLLSNKGSKVTSFLENIYRVWRLLMMITHLQQMIGEWNRNMEQEKSVTILLEEARVKYGWTYVELTSHFTHL